MTSTHSWSNPGYKKFSKHDSDYILLIDSLQETMYKCHHCGSTPGFSNQKQNGSVHSPVIGTEDQNQTRENNGIHLPYAIMGRTLSHLITCGAQGTIILPHWEAAPWWPTIAEQLPSHQCIALGQASNVLCFPPDSRFTLEHLPRGTILAIRFP